MFPKRSCSSLVRCYLKLQVSAIHIAHCMQEMIAISSDAFYQNLLHYRPLICPCRIRVENALKTQVIRISFPTRISKIQSKPTFDTR